MSITILSTTPRTATIKAFKLKIYFTIAENYLINAGNTLSHSSASDKKCGKERKTLTYKVIKYILPLNTSSFKYYYYYTLMEDNQLTECILPNKTKYPIPTEITLTKEIIPKSYHIAPPGNYELNRAKQILVEISSNNKETLDQIAIKYHTTMEEVRIWGFISPEFAEVYYAARALRANSKIENMENQELNILEDIKGAEDSLEVRKMDVRVRLHRVRSLNVQWEAARLNKRYRDKQELEVTNKDDPTVKRFQAWESWHNKHIEDATTEDSNDVKQDGTT